MECTKDSNVQRLLKKVLNTQLKIEHNTESDLSIETNALVTLLLSLSVKRYFTSDKLHLRYSFINE
jgi:hypothetical protein